MRSAVISFQRCRKAADAVLSQLRRDKINVYSAESAFYIVLSAVPFLIMLVALARYVVPDGAFEYIRFIGEQIPGVLGEYVTSEFLSFMGASVPTPLSLSAMGLLWSASRGMKALRRGVFSLYGEDSGTFIGETVRGIILTAALIALLVALLVFLVFGDALRRLLGEAVPPLRSVTDAAVRYSPVLFSVLLLQFFIFMYRTLTPVSAGMGKYKDHAKGAVFATVGWVLSSFAFSFFIDEFSNVSHIYGSLTAIMMLMLWIYMLMYILFLGAELNKYLFFRKRKVKTTEYIKQS